MERTVALSIITEKIIFLFAAILIFFQCGRQVPPLSDYQMVTFIPITSLEHGHVFVYQDTLYVLYQTDDNEHLALREYALVYPATMPLIDIYSVEPDLNIYCRSVQHDSLVILYGSYLYSPLSILNLQTHDIVDIETEYSVNSIVCKDSYMFMATEKGLVILDIADVYNIEEIYCENDTVDNFYRVVALHDTILFEYTAYSGQFIFWDIHEVSDPSVISTGTDIFEILRYVVVLDSTIIAASTYALHRFSYDFSDSLHLEETTQCDYIATVGVFASIIYVNNRHEITIFDSGDFTEYSAISPITGLHGSPSYVSVTVDRGTIYAVAYEEGLYVYERRE